MKKKTHKFVLPINAQNIQRNTMHFSFLVTTQCTFGCKECNALHFCMLIKKKGHMASRHLLGLGKSHALIGWDLLDKLTVGQTN